MKKVFFFIFNYFLHTYFIIVQVIIQFTKKSLQDTYIYQVIVVSNEKVSQNASLVQVAKGNHVLYSLHGRGVHRLDATLWSQPLFL
jgi:hypothetical protein